MKRIHYLLLGLLVSLTIAAVSPSSPPTRIIAGSGVTVVTNSAASYTISASGGSGNPATNLVVYGTTGNQGLTYVNNSGIPKITVGDNGNVTFAGTNSFTSLVDFYANTTFSGTNEFVGPILSSGDNTFTATNIFAGNLMSTGFANFARSRVLFETNDLFIPDIASSSGATTSTNTLTNLFMSGYTETNFLNVTVPALLSTNSTVSIYYELEYTNARPTVALGIVTILGTNRVNIISALGSSGAGYSWFRTQSQPAIFANRGSHTIQLVSSGTPGAANFLAGGGSSSFEDASYVDTSQPFNMSFNVTPGGAHGAYTNNFVRRFRIIETLPADTRVSQ
jgi:hypothetical protein